MFKLLLKHLAYEKAIDIFFQRIFKNFPVNSEKYKKIFIKNIEEVIIDDEPMLMILYNVELIENSNPELLSVRFEYFKYTSVEYDWMREQALSRAIKQPQAAEWYDVRKDYIIKKV